MFLGLLEKKEKVAFLKLAHHVARSDGDFSKKQMKIISTYCFEMQIMDIEYNEKKFDLQKILKTFSTNKNKKIVLLEIMALIYSDNIVHAQEQKIIDAMLKEFSFDRRIAHLYLEWTKTILSVSEQGKLLIEL